MTNSIEQAERILSGSDLCAMYDRIRANRPVINQAIQARAFFSSGWFRLWRKDVLNEKVSRRDSKAFSELRWLQQRIV